MTRMWRQILLISFSLLGYASFWWLFPDFVPWLQSSRSVPIQRIETSASHILMHLGLRPEAYTYSQQIRFDQDRVKAFAYRNRDAERTLDVEGYPAIQIRLQFRKPEGKKGLLEKIKQFQLIASKLKPPAVELVFNPAGHLIELSRTPSEDTLATRRRSDRDYDRELLNHILHFSPITSLKGMKIDSVSVFRSETSISRSIIWSNKNDSTRFYNRVTAQFVNGEIIKLSIEFVDTNEPVQSLDTGDLLNIFEGIFTASVILLVFFYLIKRLRADQISFRTGIGLGIISGLSTMIGLLLLYSVENSPLELLLGVLIGGPMIALAATVLYSTGESLARDLPRDRLQTMEALNRRKFLFRPIGHAVLNAFFYAGIIAGIFIWIFWLISRFQPGFFFLKRDLFRAFNTLYPWPVMLLNNIQLSIFLVSAHLLFVFSVLLRWFRRPFIAGLLAALPFALGASIAEIQVYPFSIWFVPGFIYGAMLCYVFYRTDFLTTLMTVIVKYFFITAALLYMFSNVLPSSNYIATLIAIALLFEYGLYVRTFGEEDIEPESLKPDYVFRLAERERLIRELEIARHIQLNFLPDETPHIPELNIASMCVPANEVGGDYFDFIPLDDQKLGLVIGDVSGKGISAAFYMTLTKGILKSLITERQSPGKVLARTNEIFYENARRGVFISLIYGIFDLRRHTFTFARAGHNPPIYLNRKTGRTELLTPGGLAIGLDRGPLFRETIEEKAIRFQPGDTFLFYTDGFSEAMNHAHQEFGESRMMDILIREMQQPAEHILNQFRQEIENFSRGQPQHDDMTMIVVKIDSQS